MKGKKVIVRIPMVFTKSRPMKMRNKVLDRNRKHKGRRDWS